MSSSSSEEEDEVVVKKSKSKKTSSSKKQKEQPRVMRRKRRLQVAVESKPQKNHARVDGDEDDEDDDEEVVRLHHERMLDAMVNCAPMSELVKQVPGLRMDQDGASKLNSMIARVNAESKKTRKRADVVKRLGVDQAPTHFEQSQHKPALLEELLAARQLLTRHKFLVEGEIAAVPHAQIQTTLRAKHEVKLPLILAKQRADMMRQAGRFHFPGLGWRDFPPCVWGNKCVGHRTFSFGGKQVSLINGLTEKVTFMRAMRSEEWDRLKTSNTQPDNTGWPCILCGEVNVTRYAMLERLAERGSLQKEEPDEVCQLWYNKVDEPGGFFRRYMLVPDPTEVLVEPIVSPAFQLMRAVKVGDTMWQVHDPAIVWRPPPDPLPYIGQSQQDFCNGAGSLSSSTMPQPPRATTTAASNAPKPISRALPSVAACSVAPPRLGPLPSPNIPLPAIPPRMPRRPPSPERSLAAPCAPGSMRDERASILSILSRQLEADPLQI